VFNTIAYLVIFKLTILKKRYKSVKKTILLISFLFLLASQSYSQLLWEISGNGLEKPSFLYGTMHLGDDRIYQFNDSLMPLFNQGDVFAGEIILEQS
jgi:uncharacterized protein YbaP (TraB family)